MKKRTDHRGFALPAAIGALVIVGILVTAGFYVARQEVRIGVASKYAGMAGSMAQSAANNVMVNRVSSLTSLAIWGTTTVVDTVESGITTVKVTKLGMRMFYLDATATVTEGGALWAGASRRVGIVTRMTTANIDPPSALATQGSLTVGGSSSVSGFDTIPSGWASACDSTSMTDKPGIMIDNPANIKVTGTNFEVAGVPTIQGDTSITASSLLVFGDLTWNDMVAIASKTMSAGPWSGIQPDSSLLGGSYRCNTANASNLGDPLRLTGVCSNYFPIIYAPGDLKFTGGYGQGILLVEHNLEVAGGFEFYGPVFVKGELKTTGTGGHFNGGVVAANVDLGTSTVLGNAVVSYSSCAIDRAVLNNSALTKVRPLAKRSWVDLSAVIKN